MKKLFRYGGLSLLSGFILLVCALVAAPPGQAHWADLSTAEVIVEPATVQITLTYPTGLSAFADDNQDNQLSASEVLAHQAALQAFFSEKIRLSDGDRSSPTLTVTAPEGRVVPGAVLAPSTHTTLRLDYTWDTPPQEPTVFYDLFLPEAPGASCLATVLRAGQLKTFVFTPKKQTLALIPRSQWLGMSETILAIAGAFVWGALHSMSPGHGKTLVGAYLIGERATPLHAVILAATTTITHTLGIFALGLVALFATRYVVPETLYPWMSLISGSMVVGIGFNLLMTRWRRDRQRRPELNASGHNHVHTDHEHADHGHSHSHSQAEHSHTGHGHTERSHVHTHHGDAEPGHSHELLHPAIPVLATSAQEHSHPHPHKYSYSHPIQSHNVLETAHANPPHTHSHAHSGHHSHAGGHSHSHLPSGADGSPVTWRSLLALGISGGLIPCPAALVLLLSAIAFGNIALGLSLVVAFSLGLAVVLTSLGLLLVYGRQFFKRVPTQSKAMRLLPTVSALSIFLLGLGISTRAMLQIFA